MKARTEPKKSDCWDLVQRIVASRHFQKSARLRDLLLYVCERSLGEAASEIHEQEIAARVFGRQPDSSGDDTIVRVQASQLRRRLDQYFATEGAAEEITIEIPKGNYAPVFKARLPEESDASMPVAGGFSRRSWLMATLIAMVLLLGAAGGWLLIENAALRRAAQSPLESQPALRSLWSQLLVKDQQTDLVLADSSLSLFERVIRRPVSLTEYVNRDHWRRLDELASNPPLQNVARMLITRPFTSIADASIVRKVSSLAAGHGRFTLFCSRDFNIRHLKTDNVILSGSARSTPWVELFQDQFNFRLGYDESRPGHFIRNLAPRPGEEALYWPYSEGGDTLAVTGYCVVAFLPNLSHTGSVLVLAGTDMIGTEAGGEFVTGEQWVTRLRSLLPSKEPGKIPYFEVLLRTRQVGTAAPSFEILAHRDH